MVSKDKIVLNLKTYKMKNAAYIFLLIFTATIFMTSCRKKKTPGEKIEDGVEQVGDGIKDAVN